MKQDFAESRSFFWPLFLIILGILLLFNNFNLLPWSIWNTLWRFWPLILILIGLEILLGQGRLANITITIIGLILIYLVLVINIPELSLWGSQILQTNFSQFPLFNR